MGPPSNLASFWQLAVQIAQGTAETVSEPLDRFLGRLHHRGVGVHERAAQFLSPPGSAPNNLHRDLLRLFGSRERIRLVTTNFDRHFEAAATELFGETPDVYRAPALPRGQDFKGIVHVHGAVERPFDLVLTDADFGRAYLTEGWARRFLEDAFRTYTVLFVGYSHTDVTMHYLARALPPQSLAGRFALTDEEGNWTLLGIDPLRFASKQFSELNEAVRRFSDRAVRGALDWQSRLADIARRAPPADEELIGELDSALGEVHTTRFFTKFASDPAWIDWLADRRHLESLFGQEPFTDRDHALASWLAQFVHEHPVPLMKLLADRKLRMSPQLWWVLGRELGIEKDKQIAPAELQRWIAVLLATAPGRRDGHILGWLAERCSAAGLPEAAMQVFLAMCEHRVSIELAPNFLQSAEQSLEMLRMKCEIGTDERTLRATWTNYLQPHPELNERLLASVVQRLEAVFTDLEGWGQSRVDWDGTCWRRHAIEPHEQDRYAESIDVLVDVARAVLAVLVGGESALRNSWVERLTRSRAPLLRRISIHAVTECAHTSADDRMDWLLTRFGLDRSMEHHEIHRLAFSAYPKCTSDTRKEVVSAILALRSPPRDNLSAEVTTARKHFNWLSWLAASDANCQIAAEALAPIQAEYPTWRPSEHPDLTHWSSGAEWVGPRSPKSVEQLLAEEPSSLLEELLSFQGSNWRGPDRDGLLFAVREACKKQPQWGHLLARELVARESYASDLWGSIIQGWRDAERTLSALEAGLKVVANQEVHTLHALDVANYLYSMTKDGDVVPTIDLLDLGDRVAHSLWVSMDSAMDAEVTDDWLSLAINHPAGVLMEYLLSSISHRAKSSVSPKDLPAQHRALFETIFQDPSIKCGLARSVLASQIAFLFDLDEAWTRVKLIPLFSSPDERSFDQCWDGFLVWGRLSPELVDALLPACNQAASRMRAEPRERFQRFVEFYAQLAVFYSDNPRQHLLPAFFKRATSDDKGLFASHVAFALRQMTPTAREQLLNRWLIAYWEERLQAVPVPLEDVEVGQMLDWLPYFEDHYPNGVSLAIRSPLRHIEHSSLLFDLKESDLVESFSDATAELLVYLAPRVANYHASSIGDIAKRLRRCSPELEQRLREALALLGTA